MPLDFSLLGQGPQFQNVLASYDAGALAKKETDTKNALALWPTDKQGAVNALAKIDPVKAIDLQAQVTKLNDQAATKAVFKETDPTKRTAAAQATGDPAVIETVMKLDDSQRAQLHGIAEEVGRAAFGALQQGATDSPEDLAKRKSFVTAQAQGLVEKGVPQAKIDEILANPTVAALHGALASAATYQQTIEQANRDRDFTAGQADKTADNKRADAQQAEAARHNRVDEGQGAARIGIERQNADNRAAGRGGRLIPQVVRMGYANNANSISKIDQALKDLDANPQAVGLTRAAGENINQRIDPKGINTRADIADIGSLILHDRSGAAVTVSEAPRLMPFIPRITDSDKAAKIKLQRLRDNIASMQGEIETQFDPSNGYAPLDSGRSAPAASAARAQPPGPKRPPLSSFQK